jgi:hypothetical protein
MQRGAEQSIMLSGQDPRLATITVEGHLTLSATINWHLSARKIDLRALLRVILGPAKIEDQSPLLEALNYLHHAYGDRRRKNGPAAVLHCLRIAAMLARVMPSLTTLDLLGAFLHDKEEDLTREELGQAEWDRLQAEFVRVLEKIDSNHPWGAHRPVVAAVLAIVLRLRGYGVVEGAHHARPAALQAGGSPGQHLGHRGSAHAD